MASKLGILAGGGDLPRQIIAQCQSENRPFFVLGFEGQANPADYQDVPFRAVRLGAAGRSMEILRSENISEIVMAGHIRRPSLAALRPDKVTMKFFLKTGAKSLGDDGLLTAVIRYLEEEEGFRIVGASSLLPNVTLPLGPLGRHGVDDDAHADIVRGLEVLTIIGPADVGQGVVVQDGIVLGVEAIEGTDALIERCAALSRKGKGAVLVKMRKPGQETRVDLPTIGPGTIRNLSKNGFRGIAIDAGGMIILDREETLSLADKLGVFIQAVAPLET
ncbi:LpxI family protein [Aestuariispira insulae]|uniref:UDP-2,3-diacylglucosamine pyrophosphatase n=1 Tax=Aestuariispira insulae TaxID=1461337 RepID=A0A3D9HV21_9PROT|nr:UDP-2,3-diacylglucosamine diphosphatase LpxI [Aestuariispira insulae]RED53289.1 hypothetical protein DFP90_10171 [Aestuariispira insulae]